MKTTDLFIHVTWFTQREVRALIEEFVDAHTDTQAEEVAAAMRVWLRIHCARCQRVISRNRRNTVDTLCAVCEKTPAPLLDDDPLGPETTQASP